MATVVSEIADAISSGTPKNDAIALTAARAGVDLSDAHFAWSRSEKQREAQDLYARRYMARNLMAYGIDRDTVAELVGCHPNHVPRMIAALREEERAAGGRAALDRPPAALPASEPADDHASP